MKNLLIKDKIGARLVKKDPILFNTYIFNNLTVLSHVLVPPEPHRSDPWPILRRFGLMSPSVARCEDGPNRLITVWVRTRCWHMITLSLRFFVGSHSVTWLELWAEWGANWAAVFIWMKVFSEPEDLFPPARLQLPVVVFLLEGEVQKLYE